MRRRSCGAAIVAAAVTLVAVARAGDAPPPGAVETKLIAAGSRFDFVAVGAPLPARRIGQISTAAIARAQGSAAAMPNVLGTAPTPPVPPGWPSRSLASVAGARAGPAPFDVSNAGHCDCATAVGDVRSGRVAVLYATRTFDIKGDAEKVRSLRLRARYRDGIVAYVNGHEVARRNIAHGRAPMALAERHRGPEWETFYIAATPGLLHTGKNLLAVEVRPSGYRLGPELDLDLAAASGPHIVRGPMLQRVSRTRATVVFDTDLPVRGEVEYGPTAALGRVAVSAGGALAVHHVVELTRLPAGGPVHYRVIAGAGVAGPFVFHTVPAPGQPIRFVVYGDSRSGHAVHARIVRSILNDAPDFVISTGDLVRSGSDEGEWQTFFQIAAPLLARVPYYPVAGNHDVGRAGDELRRMSEIFTLWPGPKKRPEDAYWYSFNVGDLHFIMLDSNAYDRPEQLAWAAADLKRADGARAIFVAVHHGPYSRGPHGGSKIARDRYVPLFRAHHVTLLFEGHDHIYQRGKIGGLAYFVTGGGGAPLYRIACGRGRRRCAPDGMRHVESAHNYIDITVYSDFLSACPKYPDGTPLEPCIRYPTRRPVRPAESGPN